MIKRFVLAFTTGALFVTPSKAATIFLPDGYAYDTAIEQPAVSDHYQAVGQVPPTRTLGGLFGVTNGEASLTNNTLPALSAGFSAPGQFVAVYDPSLNSLVPDSVIGFFNTPATDYKLWQYIESKARVPEPASWALLILGMGAVGAVLRRKRAQGAASISS